MSLRPGAVVVDSGAGGGENAHRAYGLSHRAATGEAPPTSGSAWDDDLARVEDFYAGRAGAGVHVTATPPVDDAFHGALARRGYVVTKQSSVLVRSLAADATGATTRATSTSTHDVRVLDESDVDAMLDVIDACYGSSDRAVSRARSLPLFRAPTTMFGAFVDDALAAVGALVVVIGTPADAADVRGVGLLFAGMCRPERRGHGLQAALIEARVRHAREIGLEVLTSLTEPASTSERNLRRAGFALACTQSVWTKQSPA